MLFYCGYEWCLSLSDLLSNESVEKFLGFKWESNLFLSALRVEVWGLLVQSVNRICLLQVILRRIELMHLDMPTNWCELNLSLRSPLGDFLGRGIDGIVY